MFLTLKRKLAFSFMKALRSYLRQTGNVDELKRKLPLRVLWASGVACGRGELWCPVSSHRALLRCPLLR